MQNQFYTSGYIKRAPVDVGFDKAKEEVDHRLKFEDAKEYTYYSYSSSESAESVVVMIDLCSNQKAQ